MEEQESPASDLPPPDWDNWASKTLWALLEVSALFAQREPLEGATAPQQVRKRILDAGARQQFDKVYADIKAATVIYDEDKTDKEGLRFFGPVGLPYVGRRLVKPAEAVQWALTRNIDVPAPLLEALSQLTPAPTANSATGGSEPDVPDNSSLQSKGQQTSNWIMQVQTEAARMFRALRESGASPTKHSIKADLAKWCKDNGIDTKTGISPTGEYIYRHALRKWNPPKD